MQALKKWRIPFQKMVQQKLVQLGNNRVLAFEEYGDEKGVPAIFCHGWPSSSTMAQLTEEPARDLGIRIISPDRPGISGSSFQLDLKLQDWPPVVRRLADLLELRELHVLSLSGRDP